MHRLLLFDEFWYILLFVCFLKQQQHRTILYTFLQVTFFHLATYLGYLCSSDSRLALHPCTCMIIYFPKLLLMGIWIVSNSFAVTNSAVNLLVHLSGVLVGGLLVGGLLLMSKHHRFRMLRGGCSADGISSQKGTARPASACSRVPPDGPDQGPRLHTNPSHRWGVPDRAHLVPFLIFRFCAQVKPYLLSQAPWALGLLGSGLSGLLGSGIQLWIDGCGPHAEADILVEEGTKTQRIMQKSHLSHLSTPHWSQPRW